MQIIATTTCNEFRIEFNGGKTWFVTDSHNDCWGSYSSEQKARNAFAKVIRAQGKVAA